MNGDWNDEIIDRLKLLWLRGDSAASVAYALNQEFKTDFSRSSICGKVYRLGMPIRVLRTSLRIQCERLTARAETRRKPNKGRQIAAKIKDAVPIVDTQIPFEQRKQIFDLEPNDCRWPIGHPGASDFFFCGGKTIDGMTYCPSHHKRAHNTDNQPRGLATSFRFRRAA